MSGMGGGGPAQTSRQTAAMKQKAAKRTMTVPVSRISQSGSRPPRTFLAPTPAASAANPVRTQAA